MGKKIFVVEDDPDIREILQEILESEGYQVETAVNGLRALTSLREAEALPSLIILDLMMPIMDGFQFRKNQECDPRLAAIPVLVTTAGGNIESKMMEMGVNAFLRKPFDLEDVLDTVRKYAS
jgi:CheY-like chemotaxis protein